ncbi:hypothetical protein E1B28_013494 [Marasmius oreades]|uniref:Transmembrane protein n=1 Tax=Marasmius oreades TaxID=181124 RepID=A0A9P7RPY2_9AGAR|nr:uncharacterized protein E1B28_013494 [Marasmius oreades]KAG7087537.1 hypothetical protein E1B28_013494 [Marasmius oreades]
MALSASARFKTRLSALVTRITRNRLTFVFFLFGFFHCFVQGMIQSFQFTLDAEYSSFFTSITKAAHVGPGNHTEVIQHGDRHQLRLCDDLPHNDGSCTIIFDSNDPKPIDIDHNSVGRGLIVKEIIGKSDTSAINTLTGVTLQSPKGSVALSQTCVNMLLLPAQRTQNSRRESLAFMLIQFWLFGISLMAMIRDSVPHVLTGLSARMLLTAWSTYALWRSPQYEQVYRSLIETAGTPCSFEIFGEYFQTRLKYEIIDAVLNCTALAIAAYLSLALLKRYNVESFNYVGAPPKIIRIHRYFMAVKVCLQLEAFVSLTAFGMWTDQIFNTYVGEITDYFKLFEAIFIIWTILLVPWIVTGWYGIRYEHRRATVIFIAVAFVFIASSTMLFSSQVYRWTYYSWPNFACYATASLVLLVASFVLAILCRMNFDQGLSQYLHAEAALAGSDFAQETFEHDIEKNTVGGMSDEKSKVSSVVPVPTYYTLPTLPMNSSGNSGRS